MKASFKEGQLIILYSVPHGSIDHEETFIVSLKKGASFIYSTEMGRKRKSGQIEIPLAYIVCEKLLGETLPHCLPLDEHLKKTQGQVMTFMDTYAPEVILIVGEEKQVLFPDEDFSYCLGHLKVVYERYRKEDDIDAPHR